MRRMSLLVCGGRSATGAGVVLACLAAPVRGGVITVPGDYASIQAAVSNAADGDVILIAPGDYAGPVDIADKALTLIVDGGVARVPRLAIHDLSVGRNVLVRGLGADGADGAAFPLGPHQEALVVQDNAGHVRLEDATFRGEDGNNFLPPGPAHHPPGFAAATVTQCTSVAFAHCTLTGGIGASLNDEDFQSVPGAGGTALHVVAADVSVTFSTLTGAEGGDVNATVSDAGGEGGHAIRQETGRLYVSGSTLAGGNGGHADCDIFVGCGLGGTGGSGVFLGQFFAGSASLWHHGNSFQPGAGGSSPDPLLHGSDGQPVIAYDGSSETPFHAPGRDVTATAPLREGELGELLFDGQPLDDVFAWVSLAPRWSLLPLHQGVFLVDNGLVLNLFLPLGPTAPSGDLDVPFVLPELGAGIDGAVFHVQGIFRAANGQFLLGSGSSLVLLDAGF